MTSRGREARRTALVVRLGLCLGLLGAVPAAALAHPGGLNAEGCHRVRKTGEVHCHRGRAARAQPARATSRAKAVQSFTGRVVGVMDGDTLEVMHAGRAQRIRVHGIDAPERRQAFGTRARQAAAALVFRKIVTVRVHTTDRYRRLVAEIILPDGRNLGHELVARGLAWMYRAYTDDPRLDRLEAAARRAAIGLWADPQAVAPWEFRRPRHRARR